MNRLKRGVACLLVFLVAFGWSSCTAGKEGPDYSQQTAWAYNGIGEDLEADLFLVCPTVYSGSETSFNMSLQDQETKEAFLGALNMERGIYEKTCRMYAPYYRQASLSAYEEQGPAMEKALSLAYEDVSAAFGYYLEHENQGRPIVLAGFSQGSDLCLRLLKEYFNDEELSSRLVCAYLIGWRVTQEDLDEAPWLSMARGEKDVGVLVSFNSEAEEVTSSMIVPEGVKTLSINPLNWKTDGTVASRNENLGACFTDYEGAILEEKAGLCGGYLDAARGTLKVTDVTPEEYPPVLSLFEEGVYHLYDYQFFFRNLEKNVAVRLEQWQKQASVEAA